MTTDQHDHDEQNINQSSTSNTDEALSLFGEFSSDVLAQINKSDSNFNKCLIKLIRSYKKMNTAQNSSCLSSYGKMFLKASTKGRIKVQPAAVSRRKVFNGSRQKQDCTRKRKLDLPYRKQNKKRNHNLSENIANNQLPAKKAGRTMTSVTRCPLKKKKVATKVEKP